MSKLQSVARVAALVLVPVGAAVAQEATPTLFDASEYVDQILALIPGMLAIGGAVFALLLAIKSTKWGRRAT